MTLVALMKFLTTVGSEMNNQVRFLCKCVVTLTTYKRVLRCLINFDGVQKFSLAGCTGKVSFHCVF